MRNFQPINWTRSILSALFRLASLTCLLLLVGVALPTVGVPMLLASWLSPATPGVGLMGDIAGRLSAWHKGQPLPVDDECA